MKALLQQMFGGMPREFASPQRKIVESFDSLVANIDQHNGLTDCFVSAYGFTSDERSYGDVIINKAIFDFDGTWDVLVKTHEWLEDRDVAHIVVFSGSDESGHLYILTKPTRHQQSLEYFQRDVVIDGAGLRSCRECGSSVDLRDPGSVASYWCPLCESRFSEAETRLSVDSNLIADPSTMIRIPNTWHPGAERFCIPLKPEEITEDTDRVYDLAQSQRDLSLSDVVSGSKTVELKQNPETAERLYRSYDEKRRLAGFDSDQSVLEEFEAEVAPADMLESIECECIRSMILNNEGFRTEPALGHQSRRTIICHLVELGFNPEEINGFVRWALDDEKARHSVVEEEQPVRLWRDGVKAPNAVTLKRRGLFDQSCPVHAKMPTEVSR